MEPPTIPEGFDLLKGSVELDKFKSKVLKLRESEPIYKTTFTKGAFPTTLTFNDILLVPQYGEVTSRYSYRLN